MHRGGRSRNGNRDDMITDGVDYAYGRPAGNALAALGKHFVVRYATPDRKGITAPEVTNLHAAGLSIALYYEMGAEAMRGGYSQGVTDATNAQKVIQSAGLPNLPVYAACDWEAVPADYPTIDAYLAGFASVLGLSRTGIYGSASLIAHVQAANTATWFAQTAAWSYSRVVGGIHLYQYLNGQTVAGITADLVYGMQDNYGQYAAAPTATPNAYLETEMLCMNYTQNNVIAFYDAAHWQEISYGPTVPQWINNYATALFHTIPVMPFDVVGWNLRSNLAPALKQPLFVVNPTTQTFDLIEQNATSSTKTLALTLTGQGTPIA